MNRKPVTWNERLDRPGWQISYTPLGGRFREGSYAAVWDFSRERARRLVSQCMMAVSDHGTPSENPDIAFFCAVAMKILQRGEVPAIPSAAQARLLDVIPGDLAFDESSKFAATLGPATDWTLSSSFQLDSTYEIPAWLEIAKDAALARYVTPQVSLENLLQSSERNRWVDFLVYHPFLKSRAVCEIDGSQHLDQSLGDSIRDSELSALGFHIDRITGDNWPGWVNSLRDSHKEATSAIDQQLEPSRSFSLPHAQAMFGPAQTMRLAAALVLLAQNGHFDGHSSIHIDLTDDLGIAPEVLPGILDFLHSLESLWALNVLPEHFSAHDKSWAKTEHGYVEHTGTRVVGARKVAIRLEHYTPAHADLPEVAEPTFVARSAFLPVDLPYLPLISATRRSLPRLSGNRRKSLETLLTDVLGYAGFRECQAEAIESALAGQDSLVLLPTGAGKSLIYQLTGMLQPGATIIIDPIIALIDDQMRRMRELGIDRVTGLSMESLRDTASRGNLLKSVESGQSLFVLMSPERLQSQAFRETLQSLSENILINTAVLDEAHCISEWGHDFRTAYLRVSRNLRRLCCDLNDAPPPILALTGTASPAVLRDVQREIQDGRSALQVIKPEDFDRSNLEYVIINGSESDAVERFGEAIRTRIPELLNTDLANLVKLRADQTLSGIVFVPHVKGAFGLYQTKKLVYESVKGGTPDAGQEPEGTDIGVYAGGPPGDQDQAAWAKERAAYAEQFISNHSPILVATKAFGMGIDKPNIRWTLHRGFPGSLEAFAQESGRAGRDGGPAVCALVSSSAADELVDNALDLSKPFSERREASLQPRSAQSDLTRQLYFHYRSFIGANEETASIRQLLAESPELALRGKDFDLPLPTNSEARHAFEQALFRLSLLGVVDDYTVDHSAKTVHVYTAELDNDRLDAALLEFLGKLQPGLRSFHRPRVANAPSTFNDRLMHHVQMLIEATYQTIEPARIRALSEMHQLSRSGLNGSGVRELLKSYLSSGPLNSALLEIAQSPELDGQWALSLLQTFESSTSEEWIGASARQLETFPDHPVLLWARSIGELLRTAPDFQLFTETVSSSFGRLADYGLSSEDAYRALNWFGNILLGQEPEICNPGLASLSTAWEKSDLPEQHLFTWETRLLEEAAHDPGLAEQLGRIRRRRLRSNLSELHTVISTMRE